MSDANADWIHELADRAVALLSRRPTGLVSDLDGTLSPITWPPEAATVSSPSKAALEKIASRGVLVAIVTGRMVEDARRMVGLDVVEYWGQHGQQRWFDGVALTLPEAAAFQPEIELAIEMIAALPPELGIVIEDKDIGAAFHVRESPDPEAAELAIMAALDASGTTARLKIVKGRRMIEVRTPIDWNKGDALRRIVESQQLNSVVFLGDDTTDLDAVREVASLRGDHRCEGLTVAVANPETPSPLAREADSVVDGVGEVERLLGLIATGLTASPS